MTFKTLLLLLLLLPPLRGEENIGTYRGIHVGMILQGSNYRRRRRYPRRKPLR
jgi:hypothetical protein